MNTEIKRHRHTDIGTGTGTGTHLDTYVYLRIYLLRILYVRTIYLDGNSINTQQTELNTFLVG